MCLLRKYRANRIKHATFLVWIAVLGCKLVNKKAVLSQGNRAMPQLLFLV